jgi:hypothetical protein
MFLDAGAEAEVRAFGVEQHAAQRRVARCEASASVSAAIIAASTILAFGRFRRSRSSASSASSQSRSGARCALPPAASRAFQA